MSDQPDAGPPPTAPLRRVRVALLAVGADGPVAALDAIEAQVYGIEDVTVIGATGAGPGGHDHATAPDFASFVSSLESDTDLVWIVHSDARPRPDALGALVTELDRNDASLVGSKILDAEHPDRLESVGSATDVFGEPYSGLDPDEVDLEQYDVVRDVAFVSAVSMLVRRDLLRGLRGIDPLLAPVAAGMDLSQRARVAGGRVMVVPSSEVLHAHTCDDEVAGWREWAGRMRCMLKSYRLVTLAWVVPVGTLIGFLDGIVRLALGSARPFLDISRALAWNVVHLPGSLAARNAVRAVRQVGDEELFRYQVSGSVRLRSMVAEVSERFGWVIDEDAAVITEEEMEDDASAVGPFVVGVTLVIVALATRRFWAGTLPQVGFTLPVRDPASAISGFAGGWNPAGLGSPEPVHPSAAAFGALTWLLGGWGGALQLGVAASLVAAVLASGRLLRELGVTGPTRHLAGIVAVLGAATGAMATTADLATLVAVGPTLAALALCVAPWPSDGRARLARAGGIVLAAGLAGLLAPLAGGVILVAAVLLWVVVPGVRPSVAGRGLLAADVAVLLAAPYLLAVSFDELFDTGPAYSLLPGPVEAIIVVATVAFGVTALAGRRYRVEAAGAFMIGLAVIVGSAASLHGDFGAAVSLLVAIGIVVVVGAAIGVDRDGSRVAVTGRLVAALGASALVVLATVHVVDGRAGFPADAWSDRLSFTTSIGTNEEAARILLVGAPSSLPGESRAVGGIAYRVQDAAGPSLESARLGARRLGDEAVVQLMSDVIDGRVIRPGEQLARFGIGWVAIVDAPDFASAMAGQVDMDEVPVSEDLVVFRNSVAAPRAVGSDGAIWTADGATLVGPAGPGTVRIADNADAGWQPGWSQDDWANRVSAVDGVADYRAAPSRRMLAWVGAVVLALSLVGLAVGTRWER